MNTVSLPRAGRAPLLANLARPSASPRISLVDRLAAWADRQPQHHRLGSWTALGLHRDR